MAQTFKKADILSRSYIIFMYLFLYLPIIILVLFSFNREAFPAPWSGFTFKWYHELWFNSDALWTSLYNSLVVSCCATALSISMGLALLFYMVHGGRIQNMIKLFYANLIVPEVVLAVGLLSLFSLCSIPLGKTTLIAAHTVLGLGYAVPVLYARYQELDYRLIEASLDLGASATQTFFNVILPLLRPALIVAALLVFIISFDDFVLSYFCAWPSAQTLPVYILSMLRSGVSPVVNALSTGLLLLSSLLVILFCSLTIRMRVF
jgi:spermidine/putrescine transport system permease protein